MPRQSPKHRLERIRRRHQASPTPYLDLSGLELCEIPIWAFNSELTTLNLKNNRLISLPEELILFEWLEQIDLRFNDLTVLPEFLLQLSNLQEVWVDGNPIDYFPAWIDEYGNVTHPNR